MWDKVKLGNLVRIRTGKLDANASVEGGQYPFFTCAINALRIDNYAYDCECVLIAGNGDLNVKYYFGKFNAYQRTYIIESLDSDVLNVRYLYCFMQLFMTTLRTKTIGGVIKYIKISNLTDIEIPLPNIEMQKKIVAILDKANENSEIKKQQIDLFDKLIKDTFIDMFGDPITNNKKWLEKKLENDILFITSGSRQWSEYFSEEGELFLTIRNVKESKINLDIVQYVNVPNTKETLRTKLQENDLLISITADLGRTAVVTREIAERGAYINQHLCLIRLNENLNPLYISYLLESEYGKAQFNQKDQNGVKSGLNFNSIKSLSILSPPPKMQDQFADFVIAIEEEKKRHETDFEILQTLNDALAEKCFNGEIAIKAGKTEFLELKHSDNRQNDVPVSLKEFYENINENKYYANNKVPIGLRIVHEINQNFDKDNEFTKALINSFKSLEDNAQLENQMISFVRDLESSIPISKQVIEISRKIPLLNDIYELYINFYNKQNISKVNEADLLDLMHKNKMSFDELFEEVEKFYEINNKDDYTILRNAIFALIKNGKLEQQLVSDEKEINDIEKLDYNRLSFERKKVNNYGMVLRKK